MACVATSYASELQTFVIKEAIYNSNSYFIF